MHSEPSRSNGRGSDAGFTLLEVLIAVAILAFSLASLLRSQMNAMRATRYAQSVDLGGRRIVKQLIEIEWEMRQEGWGDNDREFEGDFSDEGWPEVKYSCLVDMIELPDYTEMQQAADAAEAEEGGGGIGGVDVQDASEQAFDSLGMVWPMVKGAVERSIRKATCTVTWDIGNPEPEEFAVSTFWTDASKLKDVPPAGGEADEGDDSRDPGSSGGDSSGRGGPTPSTPSTRRGGPTQTQTGKR